MPLRSPSSPILAALLTLAALALGASPRPAHAQEAGADPLAHRLVRAVEGEAAPELEAILRAHRLAVKPFVQERLAAGLRAARAGDDAAAERHLAVAEQVAAAFARTFGEASLTRAVADARRWDAGERARKLRADSLYDAGTSLRGAAETRPQAHALYHETLGLYRALGDRMGEGTVLGGLGVVHWYLGDADSTRHYFEQALVARRAADDRQLVANSLNDLGSVSRLFFGDLPLALDYYRRAEALREEIGDAEGLGKTLLYAAPVHEALDDLETALAYYERSAEVNDAVGDAARAATAYRNAGILLKDLGRPSEALERLERARAIHEAADATDALIDVLNWIGVVHRRLGDYEAALTEYGEVVAFAEAAGDDLALAQAYSNIGVVYLSAGRPERAATFFERALGRFEAVGDAPGALAATSNLASALIEQERYEAAEPHVLDALAASRTLGDRAVEARTLVLYGTLLGRVGRFDEAAERLAEGLRLGRELAVPDLVWSALLSLGEYHELREEYARAIHHYEQAFAVLERQRGALRTEEEKSGFLAQQRYAFEDVVDLVTRLHLDAPGAGYDETAFAYAEQAKARAFLDLLGEALSDVRGGVDPALLARQERLLAERGRIQAELQALSAAAEADAARRDTLRAADADLDDAYRALKREMVRQNPRYSALQYPTPVTLDAVQADLLTDDAVLLAYAVGDSSTTLWAVTRDARALYRLPGRAEIEEAVELLRYALTSPEGGAAGRFAGAAHRLYELLLAPAEDLLTPGRALVVVPDGALFYLPFEVLLTEPAGGDRYGALPYLLRRHAVSYGPSASVLEQLRTERTARADAPGRALLAFGDPAADGLERLAYSGDEVRNIAALFAPGEADVYLRDDASEARVKAHDDLADYRYLHFATHGLIDERRPDFSSVALAGSGGEDGLLRAAEIFNLRLNADLVVLSACETGIGKLVRGEGLVGLTRAFMYAGAPSLVVSLWSVADRSTARLMEAFYRDLVGEGRAKNEALRSAKLALLDDPDLAHPFHWAPFVLVGDWD